MNAAHLRELIRGNNVVWSQLYYDELVDAGFGQLSWFRDADAPFYNCAHAVSRLGEAELEQAERFFRARGCPPAFYTDPASARWLPRRLRAAHYRELSAEREHWWGLALTRTTVERLRAGSFLKLEPRRVRIEQVAPHDRKGLRAFVDVDRASNDLPDAVARRLHDNLQRLGSGNVLLLGWVDGVPRFTGSVSIVAGRAYLAEGGTAPDFRRLGLHSHMLRARVLLAARRGARHAIFTCARSACSNHTGRALGFDRLFSRRLFQKAPTTRPWYR